ncbi:MAG TPA: translocation/assembly module TamB domain-containing protein [Terriglobales bacterium]|jgi:translocation and assembly module TamB|nr:translocation/assembly module TamB domain-containing protein [Terriglobales bacterium]
MTEPRATSRWRRIGKNLLFLTAGAIVFLAAFGWYMTTSSFQAMVRRRLVAQLERITGGRAELGSFHIVPFRFRAEVRDLTIHGLEGPGEQPYVHVDRLIANVHVISILGGEFGFRSLVIDHPSIHVLVYPDGTTNQPGPRLARTSTNAAIEKLFSVSITRLEVRHGSLLWNDKIIPLDFAASDLSIDLNYSLLHHLYESNLLAGKIDTKFDGYRPFTWMAEAHLNLSPQSIEVKSLRANSGRSHIEANGTLQDFDAPKIVANYEATLDLAEIDAEARFNEMRHGVLNVAGNGSWRSGSYQSVGRLSIKDFEWRDQNAIVRNASVTSQFSLDPRRITLSKLLGKILGGSISGDGEITNWLSKAKAKNKIDDQKGNLRLRFKDVSVAQAADSIPPSKFPLSRMGLAGSAEGTVDVRWTGPRRNAESVIALDVAPPSRGNSQLALRAHARGTYRAASDELEVQEFTASTHATQFRAAGKLDSSASLKISINTTDLNEWKPVVSALRGPSRLPVTLHGHASFNGTASGRLLNISISGNLQAEDFNIIVPATSRTPERDTAWDTLSAALQFSAHGFQAHNVVLNKDNTTLNLDFYAGLQNYQFTPQSPFSARLNTDRTDLAALLAIAGYDYPLTGTLDLQFGASGTRSSAQGHGRLLLTKATAYGEPIDRLSATLQLVGSEVKFSDVALSYREGSVTGNASHDFSSGAYQFNLAGTNFDLGKIPQLQVHKVAIDGQMDFTAQGSGTLVQPAINGTIHLRGLTLDQEKAGDYTLEAVTKGDQLQITGRSKFEEAELTIDGKASMRGDFPATVDVHFNHFDADSLLRTYLEGKVTGHSAIAGDVRVEGPLRHPREMSVTGSLTDVFLNVEEVDLRNDGPVKFSVSRQQLKFDEFHFVGARTDLRGSGTVNLTGQRQLDITAHGRVNLRLIETFNHDFTSSGVVTIDASVNGTMANPRAQGRLQVANGAISYVDLPSGLSDMNGSLIFQEDRFQIETLTAHSGGGEVNLTGFASVHNGHSTFDFTIHGDSVRLRYPPGVSSTANADLHFSGSTDASTLTGDVTVTKLAVTPGFDFGAYLARSAQSQPLPQTNPLLNKIRLDVHVVTTPELRMQTAIVRLSGDADLRLRGTAAKPALLGRADVIEGDVFFNGAKYHLERGDVSFISPVTITPVLDLQMSTRVRDYDITVSLNGSANKLKLSYRSEPPLPEPDIVALLALGRTREESAQLQSQSGQPFSGEASNAILSEALNATVSNRVQRLFGGSRIKIDPQGLSTTETNPARGPQVTIEQQVTNDLTLTYSTNVSQTSQQIIQVEYNITRNVSILAIRDQNGVVSMDVRVRRRKK